MSFSSELRIHSYCSSTACSCNEKLCYQICDLAFWPQESKAIPDHEKRHSFSVEDFLDVLDVNSLRWIPPWIIWNFNFRSTLSSVAKTFLITIDFELILKAKFFACMVLIMVSKRESSIIICWIVIWVFETKHFRTLHQWDRNSNLQ